LIDYFTIIPAVNIHSADVNVAFKLLNWIKTLRLKGSRVWKTVFNSHKWSFIELEWQFLLSIAAFLAL